MLEMLHRVLRAILSALDMPSQAACDCVHSHGKAAAASFGFRVYIEGSGRASQTLAELKPLGPVESNMRPFGLCAGEFTVPLDFDAPLPDTILTGSTWERGSR